jgi:hypothetical protein
MADSVLTRINYLLEKLRFNPPTPNGAKSMSDFRPSQHVSLTEPSATRRAAVGTLRLECDAGRLGLRTTSEIESLAGLVRRERALEAIHFGAAIRQPGYNLFALGPSETADIAPSYHFLMNGRGQRKFQGLGVREQLRPYAQASRR